MPTKQNNILLNKKLIGTTMLEKADAPMGVAFGKIVFSNISSGYSFFKDYCTANNVSFTDYPEDKFINTDNIPTLAIVDGADKEINGQGCHIYGMDCDGFDITVIGIPYPLYEMEFPHHCKSYAEMFNPKQ